MAYEASDQEISDIVLQGVQEKLRASATEAVSSKKDQLYTTLAEEEAQAVSTTIAATAGRPEKAGELGPVLETVMKRVQGNLTSGEMPYEEARERTRNNTLRMMPDILRIVGLEEIDLPHLLDTVNLYDMLAIVMKHNGLQLRELNELGDLSSRAIQDVLKTNMRREDMFAPYVNTLLTQQETDRHIPRSDEELTALEILTQLGDATYAVTIPGNPGRQFAPDKLTIYPYSLHSVYQGFLTQHNGDQRIAAILTAFNLIKSLRSVSGEVLTPLLYQDEEGNPLMTPDLLARQRRFSAQVCAALRSTIKEVYGIDVPIEDIGSYGRGTSLATKPDVDGMAVNVPEDISGQVLDGTDRHVAWGEINTYDLDPTLPQAILDQLRDGKGFTNVDFLKQLDPKIGRFIEVMVGDPEHGIVGKLAEMVPGLANVRFVTLNKSNTAMFITFEADSSEYGKLSFDMNLTAKPDDFGIQQTRYFNAYMARIEAERGKGVEVASLRTVIDLKTAASKQAKALSGSSESNTKGYKQYKVPGLVWETLVTLTREPLSYAAVIAVLERILDLPEVINAKRLARIDDVPSSLVWQDGVENRSNLNIEQAALLILNSKAVTVGGMETLRKVVEAYRAEHPRYRG